MPSFGSECDKIVMKFGCKGTSSSLAAKFHQVEGHHDQLAMGLPLVVVGLWARDTHISDQTSSFRCNLSTDSLPHNPGRP
jgi:hypothetical protein